MKVHSFHQAQSSDLLWFSLNVEDLEQEIEERRQSILTCDQLQK